MDDKQELIYHSSVQTQNVVEKTYRKQIMIKTNGERVSGEPVLGERPDNVDYNYTVPSYCKLFVLRNCS